MGHPKTLKKKSIMTKQHRIYQFETSMYFKPKDYKGYEIFLQPLVDEIGSHAKAGNLHAALLAANRLMKTEELISNFLSESNS